MNAATLSVSLAFLAGLVSFISPCVLPLVPIYLAQLVGQSVYQAANTQRDATARLITFLHAATFVAGFTLAFVALGATASTLGSFLNTHLRLLQQIGGIILVIAGLHFTGLLTIPLLYRQKRWTFRPARPSYPASLLIGIIFALAWTPCIGPILSPILVLAGSTATLQRGVWLLLAYSLGLGLPFLLLGLGLNWLSRLLTWLKPHLGKIEIGTGFLMIAVGIVVFFHLLTYFNQYFTIGVNI